MAFSTGPPLSDRNATCVQLLRAYGVGIGVLVVAVESEWPALMDQVRVLEWWVGRAGLQGLLVVMTLELATSQGSTDFDVSIRLYRKVAGFAMLACASFYLVGGVLCFGAIRGARIRMQTERLRAERDLETQEAKLAQLKARLAAYAKE
ncbi:hypothetical protein FOA52_006265 [Chlamydomonas sp. UWO 241]|nr:hypothetical protein FOA52_006265 [Chlamydomonas sp. UWO 241]